MFMHWTSITLDDNRWVVSVVDVTEVVRILHTDVLVLQPGRPAADTALVPRVKGQAKHISTVDEQDHHHSSFGIDRTLDS